MRTGFTTTGPRATPLKNRMDTGSRKTGLKAMSLSCIRTHTLRTLSGRNDVIAKKDEYDRAGTHYDAVVDEVCGDIGPDEICYTTDAEEDRLDSAYDAYLLAWCWYVAVLDAAELAGTGLARGSAIRLLGSVVVCKLTARVPDFVRHGRRWVPLASGSRGSTPAHEIGEPYRGPPHPTAAIQSVVA